MDTYVSLPAQRFAYLVRKYVHHRRMRVVEGASYCHHSSSVLHCVSSSSNSDTLSPCVVITLCHVVT